MDINRLIRVANHFDKIGAYTISDEFENKFIRTAAPVDQRKKRSKNVSESVRGDLSQLSSYYGSEFSRFFGNIIPAGKEKRDEQRQKFSYNLLYTWLSFFAQYIAKDSNNKDYLPTIKEVTRKLLEAKNIFESRKKPTVVDPEADETYLGRILIHKNDFEDVLKDFISFVDDQDGSFRNYSFDPYINKLHEVEDTVLKLNNEMKDKKPPAPAAPTPPPTGIPRGGSSSGSGGAPSGANPGSARPGAPSSGSGGAPSGANPGSARPGAPSSGSGSGAPVPSATGQGGGNASSSGRAQSDPNKPSSKQTPKKPGTIEVTDSSKVLANIVFRNYKKFYEGENNDDIRFGMRTETSLVLPTYLKISKNKDLDSAIRKEIQNSNYTPESKTKILKLYELKLKTAIEADAKNSGPTITQPPAEAPESKKDDSKKDDNDPKYKFQCSREGLFIEIKRMDTLSENDPNKYMVDYFPDIKQVIDCHSRLREKIEHKDNIQLDVLINILESKYFSLINKTQFPY
jgi:hypothetical protein